MMRTYTIRNWIIQIDRLLGALSQEVALSELSPREREAVEHLKNVRLILIEELEKRGIEVD